MITITDDDKKILWGPYWREKKINKTGLFSISTFDQSLYVAEMLSRNFFNNSGYKVLDANSCIGGNTLGFAHFIENTVDAVEWDKDNFDILKFNLENKPNVTLHHKSCFDMEGSWDVIFADPPWGGTEYDKNDSRWEAMSWVGMPTIDGIKFFLERAKIVVLKLPIAYVDADLDPFSVPYKKTFILSNYSIIILSKEKPKYDINFVKAVKIPKFNYKKYLVE